MVSCSILRPFGPQRPAQELLAKQTLLAEGARGSCSEEVMAIFDLRKDCDPQQFGLGVKEVRSRRPGLASIAR